MAKKDRPAKDLKSTDARSAYLKDKPSPRTVRKQSGTFQDRLNEAKNRPNKGSKGGAVTKVDKPRATQRQYSGPTMRMKGPEKGVDTFRPIPLRDKPIAIEGPKTAATAAARFVAGTAAKGVSLTAAFALSPSTFSYKTGGKAEAPAPAKGEKLMQGTRMRTRPETPGSYPKAKPKVSGGARPETPGSYPKARKVGEVKGAAGTAMGSFRPNASMAGGGVNKPDVKAVPPKPKARPTQSKSSDVNQFEIAKQNKKAPAIRGNWVGAVPTEMQKRGGQKIKRPNLLSLLRNRRGK